MIACDGLKTRLTARIITDLRTLMPNSVIQIVTADCIASTEYCSSHPEFCSEFIRKHFAGNFSSLHEARKCSQICLKIKIWQLRMSLQTWLQGSLLSITADGSQIACAAPSVSCDPQLMWPMTRTIIPKQEYGPFTFIPCQSIVKRNVAILPHPIDLRDVVREDYSGKIDRQSLD